MNPNKIVQERVKGESFKIDKSRFKYQTSSNEIKYLSSMFNSSAKERPTAAQVANFYKQHFNQSLVNKLLRNIIYNLYIEKAKVPKLPEDHAKFNRKTLLRYFFQFILHLFSPQYF